MTKLELQNSLNAWRKALETFQSILEKEEDEIVRDAAIKRFEYNFELAWKAVKRFAKEENEICNSPKNAFKAALKFEWISDNDIWLDMCDDRNLTTHAYNEDTAEEIYSRLKGYFKAMTELYEKLEQSVI